MFSLGKEFLLKSLGIFICHLQGMFQLGNRQAKVRYLGWVRLVLVGGGLRERARDWPWRAVLQRHRVLLSRR